MTDVTTDNEVTNAVDDKNMIKKILCNNRQPKIVKQQRSQLSIWQQQQKQELDRQAQRQAVIDKHAEVKVQEMKERILKRILEKKSDRHSSSFYGSVDFESSLKHYDGHWLCDADFIDKYKAAFSKYDYSAIQVSIEEAYIWLDIRHYFVNFDSMMNGDEFMQHMLLTLGQPVDQASPQPVVLPMEEHLKQAQLAYKHLLQSMLEASERGQREIDYHQLTTNDGRTTINNNFNYMLHRKWLLKANKNLVVDLKYDDIKSLYYGSRQTKLVWREKNYLEWGCDYLLELILGSDDSKDNSHDDGCKPSSDASHVD